jgi:hypothetical protein
MMTIEQLMNKIYEHPTEGRKRLGNWTPEDAQRFVLPQLQQELRDLQMLEAGITEVINQCDLTSGRKIVDQLNDPEAA